MAPIDPSYHNANLFGISVLSSYVLGVGASVALITRTLIRAYGGLPIAKRTRSNAPERRKDLLTLITLTTLSAALNAYHVAECFITSYTTSVLQSERALPTNIWTSSAWFPYSEKSDQWQLGRWIKDTDWLQEVAFALGGRSRDYWWAQQLSAATMIFSIFVAIEGRRRNIPHVWAFLLVAHLLGLSTAQNLFNMALLLTPLPIVKRRRSSTTARQATWTPHPALHIVPFAVAMTCTALFPYMSDNRALFITSSIPPLLTFMPLFIAQSSFIPPSWGKTHTSIHAAHSSALSTFTTSSRLSVTLHIIMTAFSMFLNIPPARQTNHNFIWTTHSITPLTRSTRFRIAISRLLSSLSDNPLVRKVGWDVILSGLSLCVWAGLRGLDTTHILSAAGVPGVRTITTAATSAVNAASSAVDAASSAATTAAKSDFVKSSINVASSAATTASTAASAAAKDFSKSAQDLAASAQDLATSTIAKLGGEAEDTAKTTARTASPTKKRRGRPSKDATAAATATAPTTRTRRATAAAAAAEHGDDDDDDEEDDPDYSPSRRETHAEQEHEEERGSTELGEGTESAALAWGMLVFGGLGFAGAGVWGAEVIGR